MDLHTQQTGHPHTMYEDKNNFYFLANCLAKRLHFDQRLN